jgi:3-oxoacyl-[acyl-carrier protein] reductase
MRLKEKVAIITGGGRGIGEATSIKFAQEGAKVVVADLAQESVDLVVNNIKNNGGVAIGITVNVADAASVDKMIDDTIKAFGKLDIIVNNAGITEDNQLLKMTEEQWDNVISVNLKGVFLCGQAAAKVMVTQDTGGVILSASSVVGIYGNFGQTNYAAAKWGVIGMTKTWAKELGRKKIRAVAVAPGFIITPMTDKIPQNVIEMFKEKTPLRALGKPEDIANAYLFLASDEASFITGAVLSVDGGIVS